MSSPNYPLLLSDLAQADYEDILAYTLRTWGTRQHAIYADVLQERTETPLESDDIWYIHTVLAQCFLPYRDQKTDRWQRKNGDFSILLVSGDIEDPRSTTGFRNVGLPFGAKPRLFQSYVCTQVIPSKFPLDNPAH